MIPHLSKSFAALIVWILIVWSGQPLFTPRVQASSNPKAPAASFPLNQPLRFERLTLEDGLSQNTVFTLLQDRQGFLWVATQDGLDRYDGYSFTVFKNDPQNSNSLSLNSVLSLFESQNGTLWIGTWGGGLNRYDPQTGTFTRYQNNPGDPASLSHNIVTAIEEDRRGRLWVGTCGGGLELLDPQSGHFTHFRNDPADPASLSSDNISTLFQDSSGALWVGTGCYGNQGAGLNRFDPQSGQATRFQHNPDDSRTLSADNISAIVQDRSGFLWIGTGGYTLKGAGIDRLDPQSGAIIHFQHDGQDPNSLSNNDIMALMIDSSGILWAGTWGGGLDLADINPEMAETRPGDKTALNFYHQVNNPYNPQSLSSDIAWSFLEDRSGIVWVGSGNGGLNKLNPQVQRFALYRNDPGDPNSLGHNAVGPVLEDSQGRIWIGTLGGGLERFDRQTGAFSHYARPASDPFSEQANTYLALYQDHQGTIWTGTLAGLGKFDPTSGQTTEYRHDPGNPDSLVDDNITSILEDRSGRLWVGTLTGLDWLDPEAGRFVHMQIPGLASVFRLYLDRDGVLWVGSWGQGLFRLDPQTVSGSQVSFTRYQHDPADPTSLSDDGVLSALQDRDGTMWFGTQAGLDHLDPAKQTFSHYQEEDGLVNNNTLCMLADNQGDFWISTNGGLSHFDPETETFHNYKVQDGLQSDEFDSGSCATTRAGEMYFGGQNGLNIFRPEAIQDNPTPPPVVLTNFSVFNQPVAADLSGAAPIKLSYSQNFIAFEFTALDFHTPLKNQYAYKLEGFDPDWIQAGTRRYASYTNLPGGDYVFRVKASNNDGVWNESGTSVPLHIVPPVWETWWFRAGLLLGLVAALVMGVRWRLESVHAQNRRLEALVQQRTAELRHTNEQLEKTIAQRQKAEAALAQKAAEEAVLADRTRLARDLHDAVTQTLFSASLLAEVIPQLWDMNQSEARKRLNELRELTRGALAEMRTLLLELRPSALTDAALPDLLRQLSEAVIGRARLPIELVVDGECELPPEVQVAIYRIAQEALNNVVKYARASRVGINLRLQPGTVRLSIMDDGVGFDPAAVPPNHLGLRIMRERAEAIGARLSIYSEPGVGTQVAVNWEKQEPKPGDQERSSLASPAAQNPE